MDTDHEIEGLEAEWQGIEGDPEAGPGGPPLPKGTYPCKLEGCRIDTENKTTGKVYDYERYQIAFRVVGKEFAGRFVNISGPLMPGDSLQILKNGLAKMRVNVPRLTLGDNIKGSGLLAAITEAAADNKCYMMIHVKPNEEYPSNPRTYLNDHLTDEEIDKLDASTSTAAPTGGAGDGKATPF